MFILVKMFCVDVFSDKVKLCCDFSMFSVGVDSTPVNDEVGISGVDDGDGSIGINLVYQLLLG